MPATPKLTVGPKQVKMGLGEAILRLVHVELRHAQGVATVPEHLRAEREMIVQALNQYELDLGFDCDADGVPDTVEIFKQTAETSCCRIVPRDTSRTAAPDSPRRRASPRRGAG